MKTKNTARRISGSCNHPAKGRPIAEVRQVGLRHLTGMTKPASYEIFSDSGPDETIEPC